VQRNYYDVKFKKIHFTIWKFFYLVTEARHIGGADDKEVFTVACQRFTIT